VLHRPLRRPLAVVLLLSLVDYGLWNWSLGASRDVIALVAGMTLIPLLIALSWLVLVGATRLTGDVARRIRAGAAARTSTAAKGTRGRAGTSAAGRTSAKSAGAPAARERRGAPGAGDGETAAATAVSSSKLAA
jgi:hypothetical protein